MVKLDFFYLNGPEKNMVGFLTTNENISFAELSQSLFSYLMCCNRCNFLTFDNLNYRFIFKNFCNRNLAIEKMKEREYTFSTIFSIIFPCKCFLFQVSVLKIVRYRYEAIRSCSNYILGYICLHLPKGQLYHSESATHLLL